MSRRRHGRDGAASFGALYGRGVVARVLFTRGRGLLVVDVVEPLRPSGHVVVRPLGWPAAVTIHRDDVASAVSAQLTLTELRSIRTEQGARFERQGCAL